VYIDENGELVFQEVEIFEEDLMEEEDLAEQDTLDNAESSNS